MSTHPVPEVSHLWKQIPGEVLSGILKDPALLKPALREAMQVMFPDLDADYTEHVVVGAMLTSLAIDQRPTLPMIDPVLFSKDAALPHFLWGLLYDAWEPQPDTGTTVFLTGYGNRSVPSQSDPNPSANLRKRIYWSALTPDLLAIYRPKLSSFFESLLAPANAKKPLMNLYLTSYFRDLYWNLHVGVSGNDVPDFAQQIGASVNIVLANATPTMDLVYQNYMKVRTLRPQLNTWLSDQVKRLSSTPDPTTLVHYWLHNSSMGTDPNFRSQDILFECFHDFVALSQWGNTIYNTMKLLNTTDGNPAIQQAFVAAMQAPTPAPGTSFDPLDRFIMELFRFINPNSASISTFQDPPVTNSPFEQYRYVFTAHAPTSMYDLHWTNPSDFDPDRFLTTPLASTNDESRSQEIGFATCPFSKESFAVGDGRSVEIANSAFGTTYPVVDGTDTPICDYAGYAPFGFGYRRCPGELLNVAVMREFLQIVWDQKLQIVKLPIAKPVQQPVGPLTVVPDIYGFAPSS